MTESDKKYQPLALMAQDLEDLEALSAHLQDAVMTLSNVDYDPKDKAFTIIANRFCWETLSQNPQDEILQRVNAGLKFTNVKKVMKKNIPADATDHVLSLLAIKPIDHQTVNLIFSGGAEIRLIVDSVQCFMADLSEPYGASGKPAHKPAEARSI